MKGKYGLHEAAHELRMPSLLTPICEPTQEKEHKAKMTRNDSAKKVLSRIETKQTGPNFVPHKNTMMRKDSVMLERAQKKSTNSRVEFPMVSPSN
jgi:hypothetical protein